jgi:CHASE3 domain sensor protein
MLVVMMMVMMVMMVMMTTEITGMIHNLRRYIYTQVSTHATTPTKERMQAGFNARYSRLEGRAPWVI